MSIFISVYTNTRNPFLTSYSPPCLTLTPPCLTLTSSSPLSRTPPLPVPTSPPPVSPPPPLGRTAAMSSAVASSSFVSFVSPRSTPRSPASARPASCTFVPRSVSGSRIYRPRSTLTRSASSYTTGWRRCTTEWIPIARRLTSCSASSRV